LRASFRDGLRLLRYSGSRVGYCPWFVLPYLEGDLWIRSRVMMTSSATMLSSSVADQESRSCRWITQSGPRVFQARCSVISRHVCSSSDGVTSTMGLGV